MSIKKLYNPEIFQGNLQKKNYFEGWFFKMVTADTKDVIAIILGIATGETIDSSHCFIQVNYKGLSEFFPFDIDSFSYKEDVFSIKIKDNYFSADKITINLSGKSLKVKGSLDFQNIVPYPKTFLSPGIMGGFSYLRFMECYHGLVSINHEVQGKLNINSTDVDFSFGNGYIEKDWGTSFPKRYLWIQCGNFVNSNASIMLAIADIPFLGTEFMGIIGFLYLDGQYHTIATYNGAKLKQIKTTDDELILTVKNFNYEFSLNAKISGVGGRLKAPIKGNMDREIKEMLMSPLNISIKKKGKLIFENHSNTASIEVCGY